MVAVEVVCCVESVEESATIVPFEVVDGVSADVVRSVCENASVGAVVVVSALTVVFPSLTVEVDVSLDGVVFAVTVASESALVLVLASLEVDKDGTALAVESPSAGAVEPSAVAVLESDVDVNGGLMVCCASAVTTVVSVFESTSVVCAFTICNSNTATEV